MDDMKDTSGKPPLNLVPLTALHDASHVMAFGDAKYAPFNWLGAVDEGDAGVRKYVAAALRHLGALWEDLDAADDESGLPHLAHALTSLLFASEIRRRQQPTCSRGTECSVHKVRAH